MMNNENAMNKDVDRRELSLEELEDVNGAGLKEIVAATTLAAMAMTGSTVSALGMASARAEENSRTRARKSAGRRRRYAPEVGFFMAGSASFQGKIVLKMLEKSTNILPYS